MRLSAQQTQATKRHLRAGLRVLRRPEPLSLAEWADKNFYLVAESSYTTGPWKSDPYQVPILNMMGNDDIEEFNWRKSARVGYTKCITAAIAYFTEHKQRNQMLWQPTDGDAEDFMKQHVQPVIRDVPALRKLAPWFGKKHSDNTLDYKRFSNSRQLFVRGGKSAGNFREKSVDVVYYDELSKFDEDVEGEGSPTKLGDKRLEGSSFPKSIRGSTPTRKGECQLTKAADKAEEDFRRYIPCPHCGEYQVLEWGGPDVPWGIKWDEGKTREAYYVCIHHGCVIEQRELAWMDERGEMRSASGMVTRDGLTFYRDDEKVPPPRKASAHIWSAYSPRTTWGKIVEDFLEAKGDPIDLKTWVNTTLGEPWEEKGQRVEAHHLYMRREHYPAQIPQGAVVVVGGVDVQPDRIECSAWAFGGDAKGTESWLVEHQIFPGDPNRWEIWERVTQWRHSAYQHESGARLRISATAIDTGGHNTDMVYKYCKQHEAERVFAIKGSSTPGAPLAGRPSKNNKGNVNLFSIGTDTAKEMILGRLKIAEPGAGYVHFPVEVDQEYCEQITAEQRVPARKNGRTVHIFKKMRARNEALDCYVYALAALEILNPDFAALARKLKPREPEPGDNPDALYYPQQPEPQPARKRRRRNSARKVGGLR